MREPANIILGLSLGTRHIGFAILKDNEIRDRRVKTFPDTWSELKLRVIQSTLKKIIQRHGISVIAIKATHPSRSSVGLNKVLQAIDAISHDSGIPVYSYPIEELERYYSRERHVNKEVLMDAVLAEYPEMIFEHTKEQSRKNPYYVRVFEAIAAARLCSQENDIP